MAVDKLFLFKDLYGIGPVKFDTVSDTLQGEIVQRYSMDR